MIAVKDQKLIEVNRTVGGDISIYQDGDGLTGNTIVLLPSNVEALVRALRTVYSEIGGDHGAA